MLDAKAERVCSIRYLPLRAKRNILQAPIEFTNLFGLPSNKVPLTIAGLSQLLQHSIPILESAYTAAPHEFVLCKVPVCRMHRFGPHLQLLFSSVADCQ